MGLPRLGLPAMVNTCEWSAVAITKVSSVQPGSARLHGIFICVFITQGCVMFLYSSLEIVKLVYLEFSVDEEATVPTT